jgi:hypothetical protein
MNGNMFSPCRYKVTASLHGYRRRFRELQILALITQDQYGIPVDIWEANGDEDFQTVTIETYSTVDIQPALSPAETLFRYSARAKGQSDIYYSSPTAGKHSGMGTKWLTPMPEEERPFGTVVENKVMPHPC